MKSLSNAYFWYKMYARIHGLKIYENNRSNNGSLVQLVTLRRRSLPTIPDHDTYLKNIFRMIIHHFIKQNILSYLCPILAPTKRDSNPYRKRLLWASASKVICSHFTFLNRLGNHGLKIGQRLDYFTLLSLQQAIKLMQ